MNARSFILPLLLLLNPLLAQTTEQPVPTPSSSADVVTSETPPTVVLIHGLGLGSWAMKRIEHALTKDGYRVVNLGYNSLKIPLEELTTTWLPAQLAANGIDLSAPTPRLYFVTHSMGGIVLRGWLNQAGVPASLHRVVMIAPPNHGSSLVDRIGTWAPFRWSTGVNGRKLSTAPDSFPNQLPAWPAGPALGIIAGNRPINPLLAHWTGGPGDGKVRVSETRLDGMSDHIVMPHSHTWIQYRQPVIAQVEAFLRDGHFKR